MKKAFLVATSGSISKKNLNFAKRKLRDFGFVEDHRQDILSEYLFYAGNYKRRAQELNEAYKSFAEVIFSVRGGGGAVHLLPFLDYNEIKNSRKILVGSSDVTILLNTLFQKTKARCLHGPNIGKTKGFHNKTINCLLNAINKKNYCVLFKDKDVLCKGLAKAPIVGGNLELLGRSLGTSFEIKTSGKIVFLEDYSMKSWRVFDILWQLKLAGKFDNVKGIILGYFTKCGKDIYKYLFEFFKDFKGPVVFHQPIGHEEPNLTIPLGEICTIDTEKGYWRITFS